MKKRPALPWLELSRYSWFVVAVAAYGAKDSCAGGGKRPDPPPAPTQVAPANTPAATPAPASPDKKVAAPPTGESRP